MEDVSQQTKIPSKGHEVRCIMRLTLRIDCLPGHSGWVSSAVYFDEGRRLGTGGCDVTVHIYTMDIEELKTIAAARLTR